MKVLKTITDHVTFAIAFMFIVFFCIDRVNPAMEFLTSIMSKWLILAFAVFAAFSSAVSIYSKPKCDNKQDKE